MREILPWPERCSFYSSSKVLCVLQYVKSLVLEVRYGMKILNLSCKKCRKIYILKILGVYTFDVVSQSAQSLLQQFKRLLCLAGNGTFRVIGCRRRVEISSPLHFGNGGLHVFMYLGNILFSLLGRCFLC